jgi:long-chain acyl-CoA synthetase
MDRAKDMIIRGGENIYCVEVEQVLTAHPQVDDAALVGLADPYLGEVPAAVVQARTGLDADELQAFAAERLAPFKLPVRLVVSQTPLPRNEGGKLMKAQLKALFAP